ncbi:MAG: putative toxin-antitoxin system toxin component, PIN family [Elusimicrobiota bacterium]|nr:putative toxin-antitoxin system toxin component, PIN family [Elusimicrobiota bacterium]
MRAANEIRVVLDTNVLVSAIGFEGRTRRAWELVESGRCRMFVSAFLLAELTRNLESKAGLTREQCAFVEKSILQLAELVAPTVRLDVIKRNDADNRILECAVAARARYLVTGNMKDLRPLGSFLGIEIISPAR